MKRNMVPALLLTLTFSVSSAAVYGDWPNVPSERQPAQIIAADIRSEVALSTDADSPPRRESGCTA